MAERVLCDEGLRVSVSGSGDRALVVVHDGTALRLWADTAELEAVLAGEPIQLSALGGYVQIEAENGTVRLEFGLQGEGRRTCTFPKERFAEALAMVRANPMPPDEHGETIVEEEG